MGIICMRSCLEASRCWLDALPMSLSPLGDQARLERCIYFYNCNQLILFLLSILAPQLSERIVVGIHDQCVLHSACNSPASLFPVHCLDPRKGRIHPGTDARGRPDIPILNPPCLMYPVYLGSQRDRLVL